MDNLGTTARSDTLPIQKAKMSIRVIDILLAIFSSLTILYVYIFNEIALIKILFALFLGVIGIFALLSYVTTKSDNRQISLEIHKLVLLDEDKLEVKEWFIKGKTSLLIGKSSVDREVDIDLRGVEYESLVNNEHAVLNYVSGVWYIEDIDSVNGVGIKRAEKRVKNKLSHESPYQINSGDIIYIANSRLIVK